MTANLKSREVYENRYDRMTVAQGRHDLSSLFRARDEFLKKVEANGGDQKPEATEFWWERLCFWLVELPLGERWSKKDETIREWMSEDEAKDERLSSARLLKEPVCYHCGKTGLRIKFKELMHRTGDYSNPKDEHVLFMLQCTHCQKNTAYWEDAEQFKHKDHLCPKCRVAMTEKDVKRGQIITTTYKCPVCKHTESSKLDLRHAKEKPDPDYESDKAMFCFDDERGKKYLEYKVHWDDLHRLFEKQKEKDTHKDLYDAVAKLDKLKVADLIGKLQPVIEAAGYIEVRFDKPEIGREFTVGFSCLDSQSSRDDYASSSALKKAVKVALAQTNWRLMSEGISYRLGYLNGRVRAYEQEEDLIRLVSKKGNDAGRSSSTNK
jgi:hypothetical protein